jgi:hypothetical protein
VVAVEKAVAVEKMVAVEKAVAVEKVAQAEFVVGLSLFNPQLNKARQISFIIAFLTQAFAVLQTAKASSVSSCNPAF